MFDKEKRTKLIRSLAVILLFSFAYICLFFNSMAGKLYYKKFTAEEVFDQIEIRIHSHLIVKGITVKVTDQDEIRFFQKLFANNLAISYSKEGKLYDYNIMIKFRNAIRKKNYVYEVFFDKGKIISRPVFLKAKGNESGPGGYLFALTDKNFEFYDKIMNYWNTYGMAEPSKQRLMLLPQQ